LKKQQTEGIDCFLDTSISR